MSTQNDIHRLTDLKRRLEEAVAEQARTEGELRAAKKQAKEEFGTDDPAELEKRLSGLRKKALQIRRQIERGMTMLEKEIQL